jgi:hypothetical protein
MSVSDPFLTLGAAITIASMQIVEHETDDGRATYVTGTA